MPVEQQPQVQRPDLRDTPSIVSYILGDRHSRLPEGGVELIGSAYEFARRAHEGQLRQGGEAYITHPIEVARILAGRIASHEAIAAALLHDVIEDCSVTRTELQGLFGDTVAHLVEGVTKINIAEDASAAGEKLSRTQKAETLRKMILAMLEDVRVIMIKFSDRIHNLSTMEALSPERQRKNATETMEIFTPLANRLGMTWFRNELAERSLPYLFPDEWYGLKAKLASKSADLAAHIDDSLGTLRKAFAEEGMEVDIFGRLKHTYSLFMKMQRLGVGVEDVHDLIGLRLIVPRKQDCYKALGIVHGIWPPIDGRFKDYIGRPKDNGYMSLHTTVIRPGSMRVEVQIRTMDMHRFAEDGMAAHWRYKEGGRTTRMEGPGDTLAEKQAWLKQLAEGMDEMHDAAAFQEALRDNILSDTIFVFTPKGRTVNLPVGSTPIDFAYSIHTDVGHRCVSALVNRRAVPLKTPLRNGDFVEIITAENHRPSRSWLDLVRTSRAKSKILQYLRSKQQDEYSGEGRKLLVRALRRRKIAESAATIEAALQAVHKSFGQSTVEALLAEIGFGGIKAEEVLRRMFPASTEPPPTAAKAPSAAESRRTRLSPASATGVQIVGLPPETPINLAKCCTPVRGDIIVGYVNSYSRVFNIHCQTCPALRRRMQSSETEGQIYPARWVGDVPKPLSVRIRVRCQDYTGLLGDISRLISAQGISINQSSTLSLLDRNGASRGIADLTYRVEVADLHQLEQLLEKLKSTDKVISVTRYFRQVRISNAGGDSTGAGAPR
jgi:guanosine-3',5'-bis(diphosphate) 3'-pyrophosphohydrolase